MLYIIDDFGQRANIFRFSPPSIFAGELVETNLMLVGQDRPLRILVVSAPGEFSIKHPFFWTLGKVLKLDDYPGEPMVFTGSPREIAQEYQAIIAGYNPDRIGVI